MNVRKLSARGVDTGDTLILSVSHHSVISATSLVTRLNDVHLLNARSVDTRVIFIMIVKHLSVNTAPNSVTPLRNVSISFATFVKSRDMKLPNALTKNVANVVVEIISQNNAHTSSVIIVEINTLIEIAPLLTSSFLRNEKTKKKLIPIFCFFFVYYFFRQNKRE